MWLEAGHVSDQALGCCRDRQQGIHHRAGSLQSPFAQIKSSGDGDGASLTLYIYRLDG